jgi:HK97 family phage major capsid protein
MTRYTNHQSRRCRFEGRVMSILTIFVGLFIVTALVIGLSGHGWAHTGVAVATIPCIGIPQILRSPGDESGGGGGGDPEAAFRAKVLDGVQKVKDSQKVIEGNFTKLDTESKQLSEKFTAHVKSFEGLPGQVEEIQRMIQKINLKVANERRAAFGDAMSRINNDPELRCLANSIVRFGASDNGRRSVPMNDDMKRMWEDHKKALAEGSGTGSAYVPTDELIVAIYSLIAEYGVYRNFDVVPLGAKTMRMVVESSDPDALWCAEGTAPTESTYTGANVTAEVKKILAWIALNNELLDDASINVADRVLRKFANAVARRLDWSAISADGTDDTTDGAFTGIFSGGTAVGAAATHTSFSALTYADMLSTMLGVNPVALTRPGTCWIAHPKAIIHMLGIKDGANRPIFLPQTDAPSFGALGSVLGFPVLLSHAAPITDGTSKPFIAFGDSQGMAVGLRRDFEFASSVDAKFTEDQTVFRARARGTVKVKDATSFAVLSTAAS